MNFVNDFLEFTKEAESPTSYFRWAAYTTVAAVLRNNVYIDLVYSKVYPNMYTLIISRRSSMVKKSTPLKTSFKLLDQVDNTKVINGRATVAGIIGVLTSPKTDAHGNQIPGAAGILYSEEISSMFIEDSYATDTLTDWYDGHTKWGSHLSSTGSVQIEDLCLSILASSNEELIRTVYDQRAMHGGLLARTMLILESEKRHKNSLMYVNADPKQDGLLVAHLRKIAKLKGAFKIEDPARKFYDNWYNEFSPLEENSSKTGIEGRIHTHALKLAMIKSCAERYDLVITRQHMEEAIQECLDLMPNYHLFASGNTGPLEKIGRELVKLLLEAPNYTMQKTKLMWHLWSHGSDLVNKTMEALLEAENIKVFTDQKSGEFCVRLTLSFVERLAKHSKEQGSK